MKANLKGMLRSGMAVLLVLCMVVGYIPAVVFANADEGAKKENLKYVSLGDSMSNGYGLPGYELNSGVEDYGDVAYGNQFADWLVEAGYANNVNHAQLAMSGIRVEDLHWLLELDYNDQEAIDLIKELIDGDWNEEKWNAKFSTGDYWTLEEICNHSRLVATYWAIVGGSYDGATFESQLPADFEHPTTHGDGAHRAQKVALVAKYFQENVAKADIISLAIGNGNLGVFGFGRIMEIIGFSSDDTYTKYNIEAAIRECSPELQAKILELKAELYAKLEEMVSSLEGDLQQMLENEKLVDVMVYIGLSMALNYAGTLEAIMKLNPDAEIILVPVMNTFGSTVNDAEGISLGDLMGAIVKPYNKYVSGLPAILQASQKETYKNGTFYYAEAPSVECIVETYAKGNLGPIVRDRFVESIVGKNGSVGMVWGLLGSMVVPVTLAEIEEYEALSDAEKVAYAAQNDKKAMSISMYLAFENAIIDGKDSAVTIESVMGLGSIMSGNPFGPIMNDFYAAAAVAGAQKLGAVAKFVELTLENKVDEMLAANNIPGAVDITLSADDIAAIISGDPDAANVIAAKTVDAIVKVVSPVRDATIADGVCNGVDAFLTGIETVLSGQGITVDLTLGGYYSTAYGETWTGSPEQKIDLAVNFAEDGDVYGFDGWLTSYVAYAIADAKGTDVYEIFGDAQAAVAGAYSAAQTTIDEAISAVWMLDSEAGTREQIDILLGGEPGDEPGDIAEAYIAGMVSQSFTSESASLLCTLLVMPEVLGETIANSELRGLLALFARCIIGNGIGAHPSANGHNALAEAVISSYENENTVQDEMDQLIKDIAKDIWNQWVNAGYVGDVEKTINKLIAHVEARYGTYEEMLLKLNTEMEELVSTKDALEAELATLKAQLAAKKAELEEVLAKQEIGSVTAPDINIEIDPDLGNNTQTTVPGNDCAVEGETVKEELEAAIADLEHAIAVLEALITDISADIADMAKVAAEIVEAVKELGKTLGEIVAAGKDLMEAMAAVKDVMTNESAFATAEQFKVAYEAAKASAMAALDALKVASGIADELMVDAEYMLDVIIADGEALYNKIKADLPKVIENAPMEVKIALAAALMVAEEKGWDKEWAEDQIRQELDKIKAEYQPEIDQAKKDLADLKAKIETEIETKYEAVKAELTAEANAKIAVLEAKKAALEAEINELKAQLAAAEEAAKATIQAQIDRLTGDLAMVDADIAHAAAHLEAALKIAHDEIVAEVNAIYAEAVAKLEKLIADLNAQLEAAIGKSLEELIALGLDGLKELKDQLIALGKDALAKLVDKLVELYEQMLYKATHGEVLAGVDMKYVALGDGSNDFAAALAELLKGKAPANLEFVNAAKPGATAADVAANLPADVADANVITLGFSQTEIIGKALSAFLNGETIDWAELMGEEAVPYVEKALAYVYEEIDARVADEQTAAMVKAIAEAYAYGAADYAINLPILIKNIREVNKTAEIVIVGMHNPLTEVAIDLPIYGKIDLSAYADVFNYLVDAVYGYGVALSVIAKDVTYVDAREVEIEKSTLGLTEVDALLNGDISALYPSAKGDAYIAEQINSALTVKMLGDANDDGVVDSYDATLIARYDVGLIGANDLNLAVCDVNGDGVVDSYDATLVARYDVGLLAA